MRRWLASRLLLQGACIIPASEASLIHVRLRDCGALQALFGVGTKRRLVIVVVNGVFHKYRYTVRRMNLPPKKSPARIRAEAARNAARNVRQKAVLLREVGRIRLGELRQRLKNNKCEGKTP